ncbi:outer membrane beta-barrel family protein [Chryseobacterium sp.]|uniref:outer membrane beta-barrel family protein n=1 Tax=Chryseobacterium sp. TaxID=1871047 RepID=UPI00334112A1
MDSNFTGRFFSIIILLIVSAATSLNAQNRIMGLILDSNQKKLINLPVILTSTKDTLSSQHTLTDSIGKFRFEIKEPGSYFIYVKAQDFKEYKSQVFYLDINDGIKELPSIVLQDKLTSLGEVIVTGKKPLFTQKTDRLIYHVNNSLASQGGDAIDVLKNTPLLKVDEADISMIGKNKLNVLINGRPVDLKGESLISYLSTISSDAILKIEIITTPPAKYAAEGNAGLINIILKKNPNLGWSASWNSSVTQRTFFSSRNNVNLNYQTEKFSLTANFLYNNNTTAAYEKDQNSFTDNFFSNNRQDKITNSQDLAPSVNFNYKFNDKTDLSLVYEYNGSDFTSDDQSKSLFYDNSVLKNELLNKGYGTIKNNFHRTHGYITHKLDQQGKSIDWGFQWLDHKIKNERNNQINNNQELSATNNFSLNNYRLGISNLDFDLPFNQINIKTGARYTFLNNNSDVRFFDIADGAPVLNPALTNMFNYKEDIWSFYASSEMKLGSKWTIQGGLRYESTYYNGKSQTNNETTARRYNNFFPSFYITYGHSKKSTYSFKYSKRINRPKLEQLNPFQWFINPFQYVEGNPFLKPSFSDNFEFTYSDNSNLSLTLYHSITKDQISYIAQFLDNGKIQRYSYYNLLNVYQYGVYANYSFTKLKNFESQVSGSYYWQKTKSQDLSLVPSTNGQGARISLNNTYKFRNNSVQLNYMHNFPSSDGTLNTNAFGFLTLGFKRSFLDKKLDLGITLSTIISKRNEITYSTVRNNVSLNGQNEYDYQSIRFNLTYRFGNNKVKGSRQKIESEEASRIK